MKQEAIHEYLFHYFKASGCDILEARPGFLKVKLTIELDKLLMNRPFYWHYVEKIGQTPETQTLILKTNPNEEEGEFVHFGSPRLHQIFASARELSPSIRLYEVQKGQTGQTALYPWLGLNAKISYCSDWKRDFILSLGLNLVSGMVVKSFQESLENMALTPKIPDYCYTLSPMIKPMSGLTRLERVIESIISEDDHTWAEEARKRWESDLSLLTQFYEDYAGEEELLETFEKEKQALQEQYEPNVKINIINGGLFYLGNHSIA
ncbi:hypothetical protein JOD43_001725 [Pullulanibacillus pueri]|uniref:YqhG n=1 Tax=Pullulanibacillus pueri TaxID=1437324 RepID=A0A8J2ZVG4_9BACL|nr:YqhG family protein [Pullulanibacillus pueri]MBM7681558.1 hypothetical protein [Pullulanibacillus pueri]GGH79674.1 hypothetical protein GCM10007096_14950 [Pullulanibacillus pueri]